MFENVRTYQTRIQTCDDPLSAYASLMARVEHCLFADIAKGQRANALKSSYLIHFGITARQFNAVRVKLEGKIASIKTRHLQRIEQKKEQIKALEEKTPVNPRQKDATCKTPSVRYFAGQAPSARRHARSGQNLSLLRIPETFCRTLSPRRKWLCNS